MQARPLLLFAGALALLAAGCRSEGEAPLGGPDDEAVEAPAPLVPDAIVFEDPATAQVEGGDTDEADSAEIVIHSGDEGPPAPVPAPADSPPSPPTTAAGFAGTCDVGAAEPMCFAFSGTSWTAEAAEAECSHAAGGVFQTAACPTEDRIGECVYRPDGDAAREIVYTFYRPMDPLIAEGVCRGTFRAF